MIGAILKCSHPRVALWVSGGPRTTSHTHIPELGWVGPKGEVTQHR